MTWLRSWRDEPLTTRPAQPTDRAALSALLADTWRRYGHAAHEDQAALLANGLSALALLRGEPVGFLGISFRPRRRSRRSLGRCISGRRAPRSRGRPHLAGAAGGTDARRATGGSQGWCAWRRPAGCKRGCSRLGSPRRIRSSPTHTPCAGRCPRSRRWHVAAGRGRHARHGAITERRGV